MDYLKTVLEAIDPALKHAKQNPGASMVFNGRHWIPVEKLLADVKTMSEIFTRQVAALEEAQSYFDREDPISYAASRVRAALDTSKSGKIED